MVLMCELITIVIRQQTKLPHELKSSVFENSVEVGTILFPTKIKPILLHNKPLSFYSENQEKFEYAKLVIRRS